ncbi:MAG: hypothetical protein CL746_04135 [Chloroflexi bacterium]|nr:hypothetical protein [Chloroflexota bacterium]MBL01550.1 hypothetical protein [Chloroflexota bacterium]
MKSIIKNPKILALLLFSISLLFFSILGGALGASLGFGFLGGPIPFISIPAEKVTSIGSYKLINSSIMFWFAGIILVLLSWRATRNMSEVPTRLQALFELIYEFFSNTADGVAGGKKHSGRLFLPLVTTIFLVVMMSNWVGIMPGVGSIGRIEDLDEWVHHHSHKYELELSEKYEDEEKVTYLAKLHVLESHANDTFVMFDDGPIGKVVPLGFGEAQRPKLSSILGYDIEQIHKYEDEVKNGNFENVKKLKKKIISSEYDYNGEGEKVGTKTVGLLVPYLRGASTDINTTLAIAIVAMISVQIWGFRRLGIKGYGGKFIINPIKKGPISTFVGILEAFGELTRTISFTFRLFGNMFAGEILLIAMAFLLPLIGIIPFMGLELFVGVIQAFIFSMLTLVFGVMAVASHGDHDDGHAEDH